MLFKIARSVLAGIGEEQQHKADFSHLQQQLEIIVAAAQLRYKQKRRHARSGEKDGRSDDGALKAPGNKAV